MSTLTSSAFSFADQFAWPAMWAIFCFMVALR
jgi:hypothetical protein